MYNKNDSNIKIAAVYSGISYQRGLLFRKKYQKVFDIIPICQFLDTDIMQYDVLVFPRGTDEEIIVQGQEKIDEFLNSNKVLISFGEVTRNWIPGCKWGGVVPEDDGPLKISAYLNRNSKKEDEKNNGISQIFNGVESNDLHWHKGATGWCCHGHLIPPEDAEVLVVNQLEQPMMYIDRYSTNGIILVTTQLDAICHAFHGVKKAEILLDNCLKWAINEILSLKEVI